jgi:hypothetical protein
MLRAMKQRGAAFKRLAEVSVTETLMRLLNRRGFLDHEAGGPILARRVGRPQSSSSTSIASNPSTAVWAMPRTAG